MKRFLLSTATALLLTATAQAQIPYTLVTETGQAYTPLTNSTSLNGTDIWDEDQYSALFPTAFDFKIGGVAATGYYLDLSFGAFINDPLQASFSGFLYGSFVDLADRGLIDSVASRSPISYTVTGTAPNRIFKAEIANAGFFDELINYGTMNDSVNIQMWLYETSGIVELRYGPSMITNPFDYFPGGTGPFIGYLKNIDQTTQQPEMLYNLAGDPDNPTIDSVDFNNPQPQVNLLNAYPANGTVYRFTPIPTGGVGVGALTGNLSVRVYPTATSSTLNIAYDGEGLANYKIISVDGSVVTEGNFNKKTNSLNVQNLAAGTYMIQIGSSTGNGMYRFTKL